MTTVDTKPNFQFTNDAFQHICSGEYDVPLKTPPMTVLDLGANEGAFTAWARQKWPNARVYAYEPVPENYRRFLSNHETDRSVRLEPVAVATSPTLKMFRGRNNSGEWSAHDLGEQEAETIEVNCLHPKSLGQFDFIKVDTEGCEVEIIENLDLGKTAALVCEYHRTHDRELIFDIMDSAGFTLHSHSRRSADRGVLRFVRSEKRGDSARIPDDLLLSGRTRDGVNFNVPARAVRFPYYRPELKDVKLFIGLPVYQKTETFFMQCLLALQAQKPCEISIHISQGDGVARSRNQITTEFLRSDCTHLLFIDCDLIFTADHVARILSHRLPIVGGFYPKKQQGPLEWVINTLPGNPPKTENELQPVKYVGTGFMCIAREVFEQMADRYPEIRYKEDYGIRGYAHDFWSMGVYRSNAQDEGRYLSEDWYFCQRWLDMGGEIFADCRVILRHIGTSIFPLQTQEAEINNPREAKHRESVASTDKADQPLQPET